MIFSPTPNLQSCWSSVIHIYAMHDALAGHTVAKATCLADCYMQKINSNRKFTGMSFLLNQPLLEQNVLPTIYCSKYIVAIEYIHSIRLK